MSILSELRNAIGIKKDARERKKIEREIERLEAEQNGSPFRFPDIGETSKNGAKTTDLKTKIAADKYYNYMEHEIYLDKAHHIKRILSFDIFDHILDSCAEGFCPLIDVSMHYFLIDISAEGYILERAHLYSAEGIGQDNDERYFMAEKRIKNVFSCPKQPELSEDVFEFDVQQLMDNEIVSRAQNRKAYWSYLKFTPHHDSFVDFNNAVQFIKTVIEAYNRRFDPTYDLEKFAAFLKGNLYLTNGIDMLRYCFIRQILARTVR